MAKARLFSSPLDDSRRARCRRPQAWSAGVPAMHGLPFRCGRRADDRAQSCAYLESESRQRRRISALFGSDETRRCSLERSDARPVAEQSRGVPSWNQHDLSRVETEPGAPGSHRLPESGRGRQGASGSARREARLAQGSARRPGHFDQALRRYLHGRHRRWQEPEGLGVQPALQDRHEQARPGAAARRERSHAASLRRRALRYHEARLGPALRTAKLRKRHACFRRQAFGCGNLGGAGVHQKPLDNARGARRARRDDAKREDKMRFLALILIGISAVATAQSPVMLVHVHGLAYSADGERLMIPSHHGLAVYENGKWSKAPGPQHDYMGFAATANYIYSSGHPAPGAGLVNPFGLLRSRDGAKTWDQLGLEGESDFHLLATGWNTNAVYVWNSSANSRMRGPGLHYTVNDGLAWKSARGEGLDGNPQAPAVHPVNASNAASDH